MTLGVRDLGRARDFYEALGWSGAQQPDDEVAFFQAGGMIFGLWAALGGHGAPGIELAQNVRSPEEVDAVLDFAISKGASLLKPAYRTDYGGYSGYFADPDNHPWEVVVAPGIEVGEDRRVHLPD